jgi:hypothetical protein
LARGLTRLAYVAKDGTPGFFNGLRVMPLAATTLWASLANQRSDQYVSLSY